MPEALQQHIFMIGYPVRSFYFALTLCVIASVGCDVASNSNPLNDQPHKLFDAVAYHPTQCPRDFNLALTDAEKQTPLNKVFVIKKSYINSTPSFLKDFSEGLKLRGWQVVDTEELQAMASGPDPDVVAIYNPELENFNAWPRLLSPDFKGVLINWADEVQTAHISHALKYAFNATDAFVARYPRALMEQLAPQRPRCFHLPHAATQHAFRQIRQNKNETVLLSGTITEDTYPMRFKALEIMSSEPRIRLRNHPGYGFRRDPTEEAKAYAEDISSHLLALSGGALPPGVPAPYVLAKHFEIPAAGTALLTDQEMEPYLAELGFEKGKHYISSPRDRLEETISYWLSPAKRSELLEITKNGQNLVAAHHTNAQRIDAFDHIAVNLVHEKRRNTHDQVLGNGALFLIRGFYDHVLRGTLDRGAVAVYSHWDKELPADFKGVHIFIDGESHGPLGVHRTHLDNMLYIGPRKDTGAKRSIYMPFASLHFAERAIGNPLDLLKPRNADAPKPYFAAYMASNCVGFRERYYDRLVELAKSHNLGEVHALGKCHGSYPDTIRPLPKSQQRSSLNWVDTAVDALSKYQFVFASENAVVDGYVTEKPINALLAGAIPIYVGSDAILEGGFLNPQSFLFVHNEATFDQQVLALAQDPKTQATMRREPIILEDQLYWYSWHQDVAEYLHKQEKPTLRDAILQAVREMESAKNAI